MTPSGGAELAAELGAASADHLATPSDAGIAAMAAAAASGRPVVATLLPATTWFLLKDHHAPARALHRPGRARRDRDGLQPRDVADGQPAARDDRGLHRLRMSPDEALSAVTINAARALLLDDEIGSIEPGKAADLAIWRVPTTAQIPYWPAADLVRTVIKRGRIVLDRA